MWIRSQGKFTLVNAVNSNVIRICIVGVDEFKMFESNRKKKKYEILCDEKWILGTYETEERALEVLNEIQSYLYDNTSLNITSGDGRSIIVNGVYQMPEK